VGVWRSGKINEKSLRIVCGGVSHGGMPAGEGGARSGMIIFAERLRDLLKCSDKIS
jgi:hypothetical protein